MSSSYYSLHEIFEFLCIVENVLSEISPLIYIYFSSLFFHKICQIINKLKTIHLDTYLFLFPIFSLWKSILLLYYERYGSLIFRILLIFCAVRDQNVNRMFIRNRFLLSYYYNELYWKLFIFQSEENIAMNANIFVFVFKFKAYVLQISFLFYLFNRFLSSFLTSSFFRLYFVFRANRFCIIYACLRKPGAPIDIQDGNCSREDVRSEKVKNQTTLFLYIYNFTDQCMVLEYTLIKILETCWNWVFNRHYLCAVKNVNSSSNKQKNRKSSIQPNFSLFHTNCSRAAEKGNNFIQFCKMMSEEV